MPKDKREPISTRAFVFANATAELSLGATKLLTLDPMQPLAEVPDGVHLIAEELGQYTKYQIEIRPEVWNVNAALTLEGKLQGAVTEKDSREPAAGLTISAAYPLTHASMKNVDMVDGHVSLRRTDVSVPARGLPLEVVRTYSSRSGDEPGPLGRAWSLNLISTVRMNLYGQAVVLGGGGNGQRYDCFRGSFDVTPGSHGCPFGPQHVAAVAWKGLEAVRSRAARVPGALYQKKDTIGTGAEFAYVTPNGNVFYYGGWQEWRKVALGVAVSKHDVEIYLVRVEDYYGNTIQRYAYEQTASQLTPRLFRVTESAGRCLELMWEGQGNPLARTQRVKAIGLQDSPECADMNAHLASASNASLGVAIEYGYDADVVPAISILTSVNRSGASWSGDKSASREEKYRYHSRPAKSELRSMEDNLVRFEYGAGEERSVWTYEWLVPGDAAGADPTTPRFSVIAAPWEQAQAVLEGESKARPLRSLIK